MERALIDIPPSGETRIVFDFFLILLERLVLTSDSWLCCQLLPRLHRPPWSTDCACGPPWSTDCACRQLRARYACAHTAWELVCASPTDTPRSACCCLTAVAVAAKARAKAQAAAEAKAKAEAEQLAAEAAAKADAARQAAVEAADAEAATNVERASVAADAAAKMRAERLGGLDVHTPHAEQWGASRDWLRNLPPLGCSSTIPPSRVHDEPVSSSPARSPGVPPSPSRSESTEQMTSLAEKVERIASELGLVNLLPVVPRVLRQANLLCGIDSPQGSFSQQADALLEVIIGSS